MKELIYRHVGKGEPSAGTLSFWMQAGDQDGGSVVELGDSLLQVVKNLDLLRVEFADQTGVQGGIEAPVTDWKAGELHQVTMTWNGDGLALYLDGQPVTVNVYAGAPLELAPDAKLVIGLASPESQPAVPGLIGQVDVLGRALLPSQIAEHFLSTVGNALSGVLGGRSALR